jgi:Holliday junction DNA helicase RuvB
MSREAIIQPADDLPLEEDRFLRPRRLNDMIGQRSVFERLLIAVDAARKRNEPLGHVLFDGPPGLGKTTFATCLHRELDVEFLQTSGPALQAPKDLIPYLTNCSERAILFVDEIHRVPKAVEEYLYSAMEDYRIDIVLGEGTNARTLNIAVSPFTLVGATTRAGMLSAPLRDRFQIREHLEFYSRQELTDIVRRNAAKLQALIDDQSAEEIAERSRGTPRVANNHLRWVRDYATSKADGNITLEITHAALKMAGVDSVGLDRQDRKYLETIIRVFAGGPAGLDAVAHTMNLASDTLEDEVEPYLLRSEFVVRTPRGRIVTAKAYQHLQISPPASDDAAGGQRNLFD